MSKSSRRLHDEYRRRLNERMRAGDEAKDYGEAKPGEPKERARSFWNLFCDFLRIANAGASAFRC
jgi:hypothetical protein